MKIFSTIFLVLFSCLAFAQTDEESQENNQEDLGFRPTLGIGMGMMTYYGELSANERSNNPMLGSLGYELRLSMPILPILEATIQFYRGSVSANETLNRNLNFQSRLTGAGINFTYNFANVLEKNRAAEPYFSIGFESLEFNSSTDLTDNFGNTYHYWDDGTIRNLPELPENISQAQRINRNYIYETDIRSLNLEGNGPYREQTFAIPIGAGVQLHLWDGAYFRLGTTMHFTFTDLLDGISADGVGVRQGDSRNDRFLFTSASLNFDLSSEKRSKSDKLKLTKADYFAIDKGDYDGDGIMDFEDDCPNTPKDLSVDSKGCPIDTDKDGVPDDLDLEPDTPFGTPVDADGVGISDDETSKSLEEFFAPSKGVFSDTSYAIQVANKTQRSGGNRSAVSRNYPPNQQQEIKSDNKMDETPKPSKAKTPAKPSGEIAGKEIDKSKEYYRVQVMAVRKFVGADKFTDIPDLVYEVGDDGVIRYYSGAFESKANADKRKSELVQKGYKDAWVKKSPATK